MTEEYELDRETATAFLVGLIASVALLVFFVVYTITWSYLAWIGIPLAGAGIVIFGLGVQQETAGNIVEACRKDVVRLLTERDGRKFSNLLQELPWNPEILHEVLDLMGEAGEVRWDRRSNRISLMRKNILSRV
ncbi:MAG: hypothetical protein ACTSU5_00490 [Promethearchaeota archaeon]